MIFMVPCISWKPTASGPEVHSWSFVAATDANATTIDGPSGCQVGDLAILFDGPSSASSIPANVVPSGWTQIDTVTADGTSGDVDFRSTISYRILTADDLTDGAMNTVTGMAGANTSRKVIAVFRSTNPITSIVVNSVQAQGVSHGNLTAQVIPSAGATQAALVIAHWRSNDGFIGGFTISAEGMTLEQGSSSAHYWAYRLMNSSPVNQSVDTLVTDDTQTMQSFFIY